MRSYRAVNSFLLQRAFKLRGSRILIQQALAIAGQATVETTGAIQDLHTALDFLDPNAEGELRRTVLLAWAVVPVLSILLKAERDPARLAMWDAIIGRLEAVSRAVAERSPEEMDLAFPDMKPERRQAIRDEIAGQAAGLKATRAGIERDVATLKEKTNPLDLSYKLQIAVLLGLSPTEAEAFVKDVNPA